MTYFFWRCINFKRKKIDHISGGDKTLFGKSLNIQQTKYIVSSPIILKLFLICYLCEDENFYTLF